MWLEILIIIQPILIAILPPVILVWLGYKFGMVKYLNGKKNELITKRYLENGVDKAIAGVEHALAVNNENHRRGLSLLKQFKETNKAGIELRKISLIKGFVDYDIKQFSVEPFYKIKALIDDDIYWNLYQLLYFLVGKSYDFLENDLKLAIESIDSDLLLKVPVNEFCDNYMERLQELHTESDKCYKIQLELVNIAMALESILFESGKLSFKDIKTFKYKPEIKEGIKRLKDAFKEELKEIMNLDSNKIESENNEKAIKKNTSK